MFLGKSTESGMLPDASGVHTRAVAGLSTFVHPLVLCHAVLKDRRMDQVV